MAVSIPQNHILYLPLIIRGHIYKASLCLFERRSQLSDRLILHEALFVGNAVEIWIFLLLFFDFGSSLVG